MHDATLNQRLAALEARLARLEERLALHTAEDEPPAMQSEVEPVTPPAPPSGAFAALESTSTTTRPRAPSSEKVRERSSVSATQILGWSGATALVLAGIYLIRLGIDSGWLTPLRQLALAALGGVGLVSGGLWLRRFDRQYAAFLPAAGVVLLFATVYGAHLYYGLIDQQSALFALVGMALLSLWLGALLESEVYALFAVLGTYSAPLFLPELRGDLLSLALYFSVWSVVFSAYALRLQRRAPYVLAMFLALIVFSWLFHRFLQAEWQGALLFQTVQFVIFLAAAALFALRTQRSMDASDAALHFFALLLFYVLQYDLLDRHLPNLAPWVALGSATLLWVVHWLVRARLGEVGQAAGHLVNAYLALVLLHAVYLNLLPDAFTPWLGLMLLAALPWLLEWSDEPRSSMWPFWLVLALVVLANVLRVVFDYDLHQAGASALLVLYPLAGYLAYLKLREDERLRAWSPAMLMLAHLCAMTAASHLIDTPALVSLVWLVLASIALMAGFALQDRRLGQSSLLMFLLAGLKITLFDLANTEALLRVGVLLVLGVSLYLGGWVYRRLPAD